LIISAKPTGKKNKYQGIRVPIFLMQGITQWNPPEGLDSKSSAEGATTRTQHSSASTGGADMLDYSIKKYHNQIYNL
jgi:hypothetical protein